VDNLFILRLLTCVIIFFISSYLFLLASSSLNPKKINIVSFTYYSFMIFTFLGSSLVFLGFRDHYLIKRISSEHYILKTYLLVCLVAILFPLVILLLNKTFFVKRSVSYNTYLKAKFSDIGFNQKLEFLIILMLFVVSLFVVVLFFVKANTIPFLGWFTGGATAKARQFLSKSEFINLYVKNIIMLQFPIVFSFYSYIKMRTTHSKKWIILFVLYFLLSIIVKTYNYEKSPIIYYLAIFFIVEILLGRTFKIFHFVVFLLCVSFLISWMYIVIFEYSSWLNIYTGPIGRILFTQVAGLFHSVQIFPDTIDYLSGSSLPTAITFILGIQDSWVRSGRVIMEYVNPTGVEYGIAGVMNTIFVGESYANWGWKGALISIIYVALLFCLTHNFLLCQDKSTINLTIYIVLFDFMTRAFQGGFVDFIYNSGVIINVTILIIIRLIIKEGLPIKIKKLT
jgi:hypothetical protein